MTLPGEERRALDETRKFLYALVHPASTPRVPKAVRERAGWLLRHYPAAWRVEAMCQKGTTQ